jgi:hypothetical protein
MSKVFLIGNGESRIGFDLNKLRPYGKIYGCNALYRDFTPDVLVAVDHGIMHEIYHSGYAYNNETWYRDWTRIPDYMYDNLVYAGLSKIDIEETKKWDVVKVNKRTDEKEFVMHGANLSGMVTLLHEDKSRTKKNINSNQLFVSWVKDKDKAHNINELYDNTDLGWGSGPSSGYVAVELEKPTEVYLIGHDLTSNTDKVNNIYKGTKHYGTKEGLPVPPNDWTTQWKFLFDTSIKTKFFKVNTEISGKDKVNQPIEEWKDCNNITYIDYKQLDKVLK